MRGGLLLLAAFALFISPDAQAAKACTEIGCVNGLTLRGDQSREWKNGNYRFELVLDNRHVTCYGELPLKPCGEQSLQCDKEGVMITESGCALPKSQHGFGDIHINDDPRKVIVRITHNNKPIITKTIVRAEYLESRPNGPGCGPVCRSASYDLFSAAGE